MNNKQSNADIKDACASLSRAVESMENRVLEIDRKISTLKRSRKEFIEDEVKRLLPDISKDVQRRLEREMPTFLSSEVRSAFFRNKKFLGLLRLSGFQADLVALQTRLAQHISQSKVEQIVRIDEEVNQLAAEKVNLAIKQKEAIDLLQVFEKTYRNNVVLPAEARAHVSRIAQAGKQQSVARRDNGKSRTHASSTRGTSYTSYGDDATDLWIYMLTDVPTSLRTLMLDAVSDQRHKHEHHQSDVASAQIRQIEPASEVYREPEATRFESLTGESQSAPAEIVTDDRLGAYS